MLDARCWIFRNALIVKSKNIQYPGTSIQNQPILAMVFVVTTDIEYMILCNYRVKPANNAKKLQPQLSENVYLKAIR